LEGANSQKEVRGLSGDKISVEWEIRELEKVAFLFVGQGAQYVGMGKDLYEAFPESKAIFDKANEILGFDLKSRCFEGPENILALTNISQPAILTVSIAAFEAFKARVNIEPEFAAGLSLGEYSALVAAGSLTFEDGLRLVRRRAEIMNEATLKHPGKMAAVLDLIFDKVKDICLKTGAEIANINAPGQVVISGKTEAVDKAKRLCLEAGAKRVIELEVSGGFHSSLMLEASRELKAVLDNTPMSSASIAVISNYTARPQYEVTEIQENLVYQIHSPVKWEDSMRFMISEGATKFFEFGPGKVLRGLMRRIEPKAEVVSIEKKEDILMQDMH
jgi:[acyl-carrier-protein] S-malonyltransferase